MKQQFALSCHSFSIKYFGKEALKNVSLEVPYGEITSIIGPSGCGKSSFLYCLNRTIDLIDGASYSGEIQVLGEPLFAPNRDLKKLRKSVGMVFQQPNPFPVSIFKNIDLPLKYHGEGSKAQRQSTIEEVLQKVGLWDEVKDDLNKSALQLSGGQQQRLCIARALALRPEVLLMDEPCSSLDPLSAQKIEDVILSLKGVHTLIVVTHNLAQARRISDRSAFFWYQEGAGALIESGSRDQIFYSPQTQVCRSYIGL